MRQNGLRASSFVAVADVDPRIADQLLDLLAFAHVAAYAEPVPGRTGAYRDHHVSGRPMDRLWVDRDATDTARQVLERSLPHLQAELETAITEGTATGSVPGGGNPLGGVAAGPGRPVGPASTGPRHRDDLDQAAVEQRWRDIVAGWDGPLAPDPVVATPPADGMAPTGSAPAGSAPAGSAPGDGARSAVGRTAPGRPARDTGTGTGTGTGWADAGRAELPSGPRDRIAPVEEEHYTPPPPVEHPPVTTTTRLGWAGVVTGPLVLVLVVVFGQQLPTWLPVLGVALLVAGFLTLVSTLHHSSSDDDEPHDPDDGAVV